MPNYEMYDPRNPKQAHQLVRIFDDPMGGADKYFFIKENDDFVIYDEQLHIYPATAGALAGTTKLFRSQFEMPMTGIRWFIDVIEQKFFKRKEEGGLPAHKLSYEQIVAGEDLHVMRSMGGGDRPGYTITNASRRDRIDGTDPQRFSISDKWLFEDGLMDYLKELADKYEQGTL